MKSHVVIRVPKRALFALVPLVVVLLVAEVAVRLQDRKSLAKRQARSYSLFFETTGGAELVPGKGGSLPLVLDPHLIYRTRPNLRSPGVTTNAQGFRSPADFVREKPPGTARVVVLGGSVAFGYGCTADEQVWTVPLARLVAERLPGRTVEVLNAAVTGYASLQERILLDTQLLDLAPDVVVLLDGWNDMNGATLNPPDKQNCNPAFYEVEQVIERGDEWGRNLLRLSALYRSLERTLRRRAEQRPSQGGERWRMHPDALPGYRRNLDAMCRMARAVGARVLIVAQPELFARAEPIPEREVAVRAKHDQEGYAAFSRATYPLFRAEAQAAARAAGASFFDATPIYDAAPEAVFVDWVHVDDRGHELLAQAVAPALLEALSGR